VSVALGSLDEAGGSRDRRLIPQRSAGCSGFPISAEGDRIVSDDVLQIISSSPANLDTVLETILANATRGHASRASARAALFSFNNRGGDDGDNSGDDDDGGDSTDGDDDDNATSDGDDGGGGTERAASGRSRAYLGRRQVLSRPQLGVGPPDRNCPI